MNSKNIKNAISMINDSIINEAIEFNGKEYTASVESENQDGISDDIFETTEIIHKENNKEMWIITPVVSAAVIFLAVTGIINGVKNNDHINLHPVEITTSSTRTTVTSETDIMSSITSVLQTNAASQTAITSKSDIASAVTSASKAIIAEAEKHNIFTDSVVLAPGDNNSPVTGTAEKIPAETEISVTSEVPVSSRINTDRNPGDYKFDIIKNSTVSDVVNQQITGTKIIFPGTSEMSGAALWVGTPDGLYMYDEYFYTLRIKTKQGNELPEGAFGGFGMTNKGEEYEIFIYSPENSERVLNSLNKYADDIIYIREECMVSVSDGGIVTSVTINGIHSKEELYEKYGEFIDNITEEQTSGNTVFRKASSKISWSRLTEDDYREKLKSFLENDEVSLSCTFNNEKLSKSEHEKIIYEFK